uniref:Uncharacterized protein n=1 Tax=Rhizophora mucronata TaxID=61149 RepID=A0A2P2KE16_RHIMU
MIENKRSPCSFDQGTITCLETKRHKADISISPKENKVKVGERITALQQLVSPYGKVPMVTLSNYRDREHGMRINGPLALKLLSLSVREKKKFPFWWHSHT